MTAKYGMTRKLENLFELPEDADPVLSTTHTVESAQTALTEINDAIDKIDAALPGVRDLAASDREMDDLATKATESFDNLMDLGMQVDSRYASEIFSVAGQMLGHAITAKTAKMTKKLKMIDLQLRKAKLDQDTGNTDNMPTAQGVVLDRNELLRRLTAGSSDDTTAQ